MFTTTKSPSRKPTTSTTRRPTTKQVVKTTTQPSVSTKSPKDKKPISATSSVTSEDSDDLSSDKIRDDKKKAHQKSKKPARKRSRAKGNVSVSKTMEYEIDEMLPNMKLLLKKRKDWNFRDPDYIRAAYIESETGIMEQWKSVNAKIKSVKNTDIQFKSNLNNDLKMRHLLRKIEKERMEKRKLRQILRNYQYPPQFPPVQIYTNATTQLRQSYIHNNPAVPAFVVQHFAKFRKPPFKTTKKTQYKVTRCG